ncbi:SLOG family protein [Ruminococcus sp. NK3A76]|uniref:SLOG family protein n=1 Tax=Ruminococcus sp. NK3A76 TaxID=877411 RepID=UPI00068BCFDE|nr:SLOG family protein [Ruminococcus sp. NK3A76]
MKEKTVVFIGHSDITGLDTEKLTAKITELINKGYTDFMSGGMGGFDRVSAKTVYGLKRKYPHIKNILVIPYLDYNIYDRSIFDEVIFPECLENVPHRAAIPKRNEYMISTASAAVCFVRHITGGAAKSLDMRKNVA